MNMKEIYYLLLWRIRYYYKDIKGRKFCSTFVLIQTTMKLRILNANKLYIHILIHEEET